MIWVVIGYALIVIGTVGAVVVTTWRSIGRVGRGRWSLIYIPCYLMVIIPLLRLSAGYALRSWRTWLPFAVCVVVGVTVGIPAHVWAKQKKAQRAAERDRFGITD